MKLHHEGHEDHEGGVFPIALGFKFCLGELRDLRGAIET